MKRRKAWISPPPSADINVTPLIDVVLVLLIIFMVISPIVNDKLATHLAETMDVPEARPDPMQIIVRLEPDGAIKMDQVVVAPDVYVNVLRERLQRQTSMDKLVLFDADDAVKYGQLISLLDGAKQAGALTLGFVMPEAR